MAFPLCSASALGHKLLAEDEASTASVIANAVSLVIAAFVIVRLGVVAREVFRRSGVADGAHPGTRAELV